MKVLLFVNGWVGWQVARWLARQDAEVVGLVLHPAGRRRYGREIEAAFPDVPRLDGAALRTPEARAAVEALQPVMGLSIYFGYLFEPALISCFPRGLVNLHPGLLPYNRGAYPNVWSLVDQTPAGVTLHQIDAGIDTGPVLAQRPVPTHPTDTGATLYARLEQAAVRLFQASWPALEAGTLVPKPQPAEAGTYHARRDVKALDEIDLDATYTGRDLLNRLRARTFPPHRGAFIREGGQKIYLRLHLDAVPDTPNPDAP